MSTVRFRVAVADDDPGFRSVFEEILSSSHELVGIAEDGHQLVLLVREHTPDVVVLDIAMPNMNGFEVFEHCRREGNLAHFIYCTGHGNQAYVQHALKLGARGYVLKSALVEDLLPAVARVMDGGIFVSPAISIEA